MVIGVVVGSVVTSHKTESMDGLPLRIVHRITPDGKGTDNYLVAVDAVNAANGEYVLIASGSTARQTSLTDTKPVDAIIMAIVDMWQVNEEVMYDRMTPTASL